jgi:hypothetical protein
MRWSKYIERYQSVDGNHRQVDAKELRNTGLFRHAEIRRRRSAADGWMR